MPSSAFIAALDVGTSSVRALLFDRLGRQQPNFGKQATYQITTTPGGGAEADPDALLRLCVECLSKLHEQMRAAGIQPAAVGFCAFWHSFLGIDGDSKPTTPILHLFDTRSAQEAAELATRLDPKRVHARTGCRIHTSYWPAKLLWLSRRRPDAFQNTRRWISFGEYLFLQLFGHPTASTSMVSGSGLWNQAANDYDPEVLDALPISRDMLCPADRMDEPQTKLTGSYRAQWPLLDGVPWYPALGDGACNNIGSGCASGREFSLMVGTSAAMRAVVQRDSLEVAEGLWCYRVDRKRLVAGGALSNGGDVYAWMHRTLQLPESAETERYLRAATPASHGLLLLPFFAGERSPYWRADLRAAITGLSLATQPIEILQAALESVALRFAEIYAMMAAGLGAPERVIASGGALLASPAWTRMMADALAAPVVPCLEPEATARGAALLASERLGAIPDVSGVPFDAGPKIDPDPERSKAYQTLLDAQRKLFGKLFGES